MIITIYSREDLQNYVAGLLYKYNYKHAAHFGHQEVLSYATEIALLFLAQTFEWVRCEWTTPFDHLGRWGRTFDDSVFNDLDLCKELDDYLKAKDKQFLYTSN